MAEECSYLTSNNFLLPLPLFISSPSHLYQHWFSVSMGVWVRFGFGEGKVKQNDEQRKVEESMLSEEQEVSKYMGSEDSKPTEDEPVLHPPVHSTFRPDQVMYRPTF